MPKWGRDRPVSVETVTIADRIRSKYYSFRELLALNNECLEFMAALQEDLQYVPPLGRMLGCSLPPVFHLVRGVVERIEALTGVRQTTLTAAVDAQQLEIERYAAALDELRAPRFSAWLSEIHAGTATEVGSKAAYLGEIRNKVGLPVPDGFVITTESYRQYCGIPLWKQIRDTIGELDLNDLKAVHGASEALTAAVMALPLPRAVEVAIAGRSRALLERGGAMAVRSSAVGEGGTRTFAGQYLSLLNVRCADTVEAYRRVIAGRFSERALSYRLSTGLLEVDSPMAALFILSIPARASGIMYTRDPGDLKSKTLWVSATRGLGVEIASGRQPPDRFLVSRSRPHAVLERKIVYKQEQIVDDERGGVVSVPLPPGATDQASIQEGHLHTLAQWGVEIENHFQAPQDIEWVLGLDDRLWIVQSRPLIHTHHMRSKSRSHPKSGPKTDPLIAGGRTVYPGRTSGPAYLVDTQGDFSGAPQGAIMFLRRPSPEIIQIFPRIAGLVAEWGNITGHAAALLREFEIPAVFEMPGAFERLHDGDNVSLDAVEACVYAGVLWPPSRMEVSLAERYRERAGDPVSRKLLALNLLDPNAHNFQPAGCISAHDVLRYCHEKAIEAMFEINDAGLEQNAQFSKEMHTRLPLNIRVLDLGGGLAIDDPGARSVEPAQIVSRPFRALWKGITHPGVSWRREMPARIGDLASVLAISLTPRGGDMRPLGEKSYLIVAAEYMNLNSRLAYHYSLVDASVSDKPSSNYISFRFEGGGSTRERRSLRAWFIEKCLAKYGFRVDRRGDLVNAWYRKAPAEDTEERLDILGRLLACSSQLDMYMTSQDTMNWYVQQFLEGNYTFRKVPTPGGRG